MEVKDKTVTLEILKTIKDLEDSEVSSLKTEIANEVTRATSAEAAETTRAEAVEATKADATDLDKTNRSLSALWKINEGQTYDFETATDEAYEADVPTGAKMANVLSYGGKSRVWNQLCDPKASFNFGGNVTATSSNGTFTLNGTSAGIATTKSFNVRPQSITGHIYLFLVTKSTDDIRWYLYLNDSTTISTNVTDGYCYVATTTGDYIDLEIGTKSSGITYDNATTTPFMFDLTQMFGVTTTSAVTDEMKAFCERYAAEYPEYNAGEIISADVDEVEVVGVNIAVPNDKLPYTNAGVTFSRNANGSVHRSGTSTGYPFVSVADIPLENGVQYYVCFDDTRIIDKSSGSRKVIKSGKGSFTADADYPNAFLEVTASTSITYNDDVYPMVVKGSSSTSYSPYSCYTATIDSNIRALPGYGWSAGSVYNEVDVENKKYVQRVGRVDLGTLSWNTYDTNIFKTTDITDRGIGNTNGVCSAYTVANTFHESTSYDSYSAIMTFYKAGVNVYVKDTSISTADAMKAKLSGVYLYYELATYVETPLTDNEISNLEAIEVEGGGTVTYHNDNLLAVPYENEYAIEVVKTDFPTLDEAKSYLDIT